MRFDGTIHLADDPTRIPATMRVSDGRIVIECEGEAIGDWLASDVTLDHRPEGIVLHVEGETLVVNPHDRYGFSDAVEAEVANVPTKRGLFRRSKSPSDTPKAKKKPASEGQTSRRGEKKRSRRRKGIEADETDDGGEPASPSHPTPEVSSSASVLEQAAQARATWAEKSRPAEGDGESEDPADLPSIRRPGRQQNLPPVDPPSPFGRDDEPAVPEPRAHPADDPRRETQSPQGRLSDRVGGADDVQRIPGRSKSLSDAVRSARDEPVLPGFRQAKEPDEIDKPFDLTAEIFGEAKEPEPKRGQLKRLGDRWLNLPLSYRRAALGLAVLVLLWLLIPAVVATVMVLTGLVSCLVGGAGLADPSYTRRLPSQLSETRLLIAGAIMLVVGILIGLPSL
jgi:hypothetical protein